MQLSVKTPEKRFLQAFFSLLLLVLLGVAAFNYRMNPYGFFDAFPFTLKTSRSSGAVFDVMRQVKAYEALAYNPEYLLIGSSRGGYGLKDGGEFLSQHLGKRAYNISMPGMTPYEMSRYLEHVDSFRHIEGAVTGLDFFAFNTHYRQTQPGFSEERLLVESDSGSASVILLRHWLSESVTALLSYTAFQNSQRAMKNAPELGPGRQIVNADGGWGDDLARRKSDNWKEIFRKTELIYIGKHWFGHENEHFSLHGSGSRLVIYENMLRYAQRNNIKMTLFLSPMHARMHVLLQQLGLFPCLDEWKRELWRINNQVALEYNSHPFPLWDFSYVSEQTSEMLRKDVAPQWFTDSTHYHPRMGNLMLARMYSDTATDFGQRLDTLTELGPVLQQQHSHLQDYRDANPVQDKELAALIDSVWHGNIPPIDSCSSH